MKVYIIRHVTSGLIIARSSGINDGDHELVCYADIEEGGEFTSDDPVLQDLLRKVFVAGIRWGRIYKDKNIKH